MKIRVLILLFHICGFLLLSLSAYSQSYENLIVINETCQDLDIKKDTLFYSDSLYRAMSEGLIGEGGQLPEFPGGEYALIEFFKNNVVYPEQSIKDNFEGKVSMVFSITPEGCIGRLRIREKVRFDIENECVRVLKILPRFKPATSLTKTNKGWYWKPGPIWYSVVLNFSLGNDTDKRGIIIKPKTQTSLD